jgi:hypothetical protein
MVSVLYLFELIQDNSMEIKDTKFNFNLLKNVLESYSISEVSKLLSVNKNTVQRWILLESVPWQYHVDLKKILGLEIDYTKYSFIEKDQFFTSEKMSVYCFNVLKDKLKELSVNEEDYLFLEPSAGNGSFYKILPEDKRIGLDIEPKLDGIVKQDFLSWTPNSNKLICVGNPPFGLRGNLALRFINHAANFCDFVAFILPPLFDSDGKGSCMGRVENLNLIHSEKINTEFYYPNGDKIKINVVFQIWAKNHSIKKESKIKCDEYVKIYSLTDGGTPGTTRNKDMLDKCDFYLASSSFEKEKMKTYPTFEDLPNRRGYGLKILKDYENTYKIIQKIDWPSKSFLATNSSYNLRTSIIEHAIIEKGLKNN